MDKNVKMLREALASVTKSMKSAGVDYSPKAGDLASERSKDVVPLSAAYERSIEECFGDSAYEVLGGYDIADEMMEGKHGDELLDDICKHVSEKYLSEKPKKQHAKRCPSLKESTGNFYVQPNLPLLAFQSYSDILSDDGYPDENDFLDADGNVDYDAYDKAVNDFMDKYYSDYVTFDDDVIESLKDDIYDFNVATGREADRLAAKHDDDYYAYGLRDIEVEFRPGHFDGYQLYVRNWNNLVDVLDKEDAAAEAKRFLDFFRMLKGKYGLTELKVAWTASNGETAYIDVDKVKDAASGKKESKDESKGKPKSKCKKVREGYLGQTVEDFFDDCGDASAINRVIVYALDDEEPVYDGEYYDLPESILEAPFLEFGTIGKLIVNVADEGSSDYYDTLDDFLGDANVDDVQVWDSDSEDIAYDGDKDSVDDELGQKSFLSFDGPKYITINLDCDKSELDLDDLEEAKGKKGKKKGIHARTNVGDPKRNAAFFNMAMGASEYAGKGDGCCAGEGAEAAGSVSEAADDKPEFIYVKGEPNAGFHELCDGEGASDCHRIDLNDTFIWRPIKALSLKVEDPKRVYGDAKVFDRFKIYYDLDDEGKAYTSVYFLALAGRDKGFWAIAFDTDKYNMIFIINPAIFEVNEPKSEGLKGNLRREDYIGNRRSPRNTVECPDLTLSEIQDIASIYGVDAYNSGVKGKYYIQGHAEDIEEFKRELFYDGFLSEAADEGADRKKALKKAFNLIKRKGCYAVIYAYTQGNGTMFLNPPLCKDSQEEVQKFVDVFKRGKQSTKVVVDVLYKSQVADIDTFDELIGKEAKTDEGARDKGLGNNKAYLKRDKSAEGVREAKKNGSKLDINGIQYFGTKNQFNYDKQQLRIDHDAKTYEKGMFTHISKRETVTTPELKRIIQRLDGMGYKELKGDKQ